MTYNVEVYIEINGTYFKTNCEMWLYKLSRYPVSFDIIYFVVIYMCTSISKRTLRRKNVALDSENSFLLQTPCWWLLKDYRSVIHFKEKLEIEEDILLRRGKEIGWWSIFFIISVWRGLIFLGELILDRRDVFLLGYPSFFRQILRRIYYPLGGIPKINWLYMLELAWVSSKFTLCFISYFKII